MLILEGQHAKERIQVLDEEDVLNGVNRISDVILIFVSIVSLFQIAASRTHVGYTSDSGEVGVFDVNTKVKTIMRTQHSSVSNFRHFE